MKSGDLIPLELYPVSDFEQKPHEHIDVEKIDIIEQRICEFSPYLLKLLLKDKTTGNYIRWACDDYARYGEAYTAEKEILPELIIGKHTKTIKPRTSKTKEEQLNRTHKSAEVFTPSWICNEMNNLCDDVWFSRENVFNTVQGNVWKTNTECIQFSTDTKSKKLPWQEYVDLKKLEITCGEAPFITSRYDTTTGEFLEVEDRVGFLDRKLRIVNENTDNEFDWFHWAKRAYESTYGYEYQGDNLLLARENLLWTFIDNYRYKFYKGVPLKLVNQIANTIAWNIWQMDGLTNTCPYSEQEHRQLNFFPDILDNESKVYCKIKDWRSKIVLFFKDIAEK